MDEGKTAPKPPDSEPATADPGHTLEVQQQFLLHQPALMAYALSLVPCRQDAQDLVQETFLIVSRKADYWAEGSSFMAWAGTILRYEALHHLRALRRRPMTLEEDLLELLHGNESLDDDLLHQIHQLKQCIQKLLPRARQVVILRYHAAMLPESIDPIGGYRSRYRSTGQGDNPPEKGETPWRIEYRWELPVDSSGQLPDGRIFHGTGGLTDLLAEDPKRLAIAFVSRLSRYATGTPIRYSDRDEIERIVESTRDRNFGVRSLIHAFSESPMFLSIEEKSR